MVPTWKAQILSLGSSFYELGVRHSPSVVVMSMHAGSLSKLVTIVWITGLAAGLLWLTFRYYGPSGKGFRRARDPKQATQLRRLIIVILAALWLINTVSVLR